jgi:hypothetical protein
LEISGPVPLRLHGARDGVTQLSYIWVPDSTRLLKHFTYDGLGRLIRTLSPFPSPDNSTGLRSERFYYDGIRRIQEVVVDPVVSLDVATLSGGSVGTAAGQAQSGSGQPLDGAGTPVVVEQAQLADPNPTAPAGTFLNREYIWGPGGVDELLCQYDWQRKPWFTLMDDGGDLVALCDRDPTTLRGRVAAEYTFDAYGQVLTAQTYSSMSSNAHPHCGHKGLFVDRLEAPIVGSGNFETPRLAPLSTPLVQNRNRAYLPTLGRFVQQDPNAMGQSVLAAASFNGRGMTALSVAFGLSEHYGDGLNAYEYLGSNPWARSDSMGLAWDPFDLVDDFNASRAGSASALLNQIGAGMQAAAMVAATIASELPFPMVGFLGQLSTALLNGDDIGEFLGQQATGLLMGCIPGAHLLMDIGSFALSFIEANTDPNQVDDGDAEDGEDPDSAEVSPRVAKTAPAYWNTKDGPGTHYIYVGRKGGPTGPIVYVGITTDPPARFIAHATKGVHITPITDKKFSEYHARGIETAIMTKFPGARSMSGREIHPQFKSHPPLRNRRRSIGKKWRLLTDALMEGLHLLRDVAPAVAEELGMGG